MGRETQGHCSRQSCRSPRDSQKGTSWGGGAWRAAWLFVYLSCLFEMDVFDEEETSAVQSLMSGTYITV